MSVRGVLRRTAKRRSYRAVGPLLLLCIVGSGCASGGTRSSGGSGGLFARGGAPWTIQCLELSGPVRNSFIKQFAETLRRTPGIRSGDVFLRDESDGFARLYYGTYYRRTDPKTRKRSRPRRMEADLALIRQLGGPSGERYFARALPVRLPTPDVGNPAWRLDRADGLYTLQVASFEPTDDFWDFKQVAAEYCEFLRKKGHEAYYHHARSSSVVTVGAFGPEAVERRSDQRAYYSDIVVALQRNELFSYNVVNGGVVYVRDGQGRRVAMPSRLVEIPGKTPPE